MQGFGMWLESVAIVPQLIVIIGTSSPKNIIMYYLATLQGGCRFFNLLDLLIYQGFRSENSYAVYAGFVQACLSAITLGYIIIVHRTKSSILPEFSDRIVLRFLRLLRFVQLGAAAINGYIFGSSAWSYENHYYCPRYPCTPDEMVLVNIPWPLILIFMMVNSLGVLNVNFRLEYCHHFG